MSGQKLVVFHRQRGQRGHLRVRSGVLHAMRPRAVPDSKGVQWFDVHRGRDMRAALPPFDGKHALEVHKVRAVARGARAVDSPLTGNRMTQVHAAKDDGSQSGT